MNLYLTKETFFNPTDRLQDVVVIRSFAIILVVAYHAINLMMDPSQFPDSMETYTAIYFNVNKVLFRFRMPLFIFISGYLFSYLENEKGKYRGLWNLLKNKFSRLIIPFFIFATLMMLSLNKFHWIYLFKGDYQHFWFITMLFWCFITTRLVTYLPIQTNLKWKCSFLFILFILTSVKIPSFPLFGLQNIPKWLFWFYLGYTILLYRDKVYGLINRNALLIVPFLLLVWLGTCYCKINHTNLGGQYAEPLIYNFGYFTVVISIWYIINAYLFRFGNGWISRYKISNLNKYCYGIYVFHYWFQAFMISTTAKNLFNLRSLAAEHVFLFPLAFIVISFSISLVFTRLILKTRLGRFLVG